MTTSPVTNQGVQRYANVYWKSSGSHHVVEDPEGEYVKYDDYEALLNIFNLWEAGMLQTQEAMDRFRLEFRP